MNTRLDCDRMRDRLHAGLAWVLQHQNRDGSWSYRSPYASSLSEKITYSCQAINLLIEAGFPKDDRRIVRTTRWLADNIDERTKHRFSRTQVLLVAGDYGTLVNNGDMGDFVEKVHSYLDAPDMNPEINLFWHILPTLIELKANENNVPDSFRNQVPFDKIAEHLGSAHEKTYREDDCISVANKPNHTGLAALYLATVDKNTYAGRIRGLTNWIIESHSTATNGIVHWDHSRGITAYVIMDLLRLPQGSKMAIRPLLSGAVEFVMPARNGVSPADTRPTFDTSLHGESLYVTILAIRAILTVLKTEVEKGTELTGIARTRALESFRKRPLRTRARTWLRRRIKFLPWVLIVLVLLTSSALYVALPVGRAWFQNTVFLCLGALLSCALQVVPSRRE